MAEFTDLRITYESKTPDKAILTFDGGVQSLVIAVTPLPSTPVGPGATVIASSEQLVAAMKTAGTYRVVAGQYAVNLVAAVPGVTITCADGVTLSAKDPYTPLIQVSADRFSWTGGDCQAGVNDGIRVGSNSATTVEAQPHGVVFEDLTLDADPTAGGLRGFALHGVDITLERVRVLNYWRKGQDTQAVWINNGPGPYTLRDCYFEAAGENILTCGDSIQIPDCIPSDITITGCTCYKPDRWRTDGSTVKNLLEFKGGQRILVEDCVFDNCWKAAQSGHPIVFTVRDTSGRSPWTILNDVTFRHNIVSHAPTGYGVNILGLDYAHPTQQTKTMTIVDNLFEHCTGGIQLSKGVTEQFTIERNTFPAITGAILIFADTVIKTVLSMTENVSKSGVYGLFAVGGLKGEPALKAGCTSYVFVRNVIEKSTYTSNGVPVVANIPWPAGNTILPPKGLTYGPQFTYDADGDGTPDAGWSGGAFVQAVEEAPIMSRRAKKAAVTEALEPTVEQPRVEPEPPPVTQEDVNEAMNDAARTPDESDPPVEGA